VSDFNEGRGMEGLEREKRTMAGKIDFTSTPGHWIWLGRVNMWGTPVVENLDGDVATAAEVVYHLWKRMVPPAPFTRHCPESRCVRPDCFRAPRIRGKAKRPAVRAALLQSGRTGVEFCHRGHRMSETRRRTPQGVAYCSECGRIKAKDRWAAELERRKREGS